MTISLVGMLVSAILSLLIIAPLPKHMSNMRKIGILAQWIFVPAILIIFGAFPALDAQIRLMLGRYMGFWVTDKIRK